MWIRKKKIKQLSDEVKLLISSEDIDIREHKEGPLMVLRNDIHTLFMHKKEQFDIVNKDKEVLKDTLADISHQLKTPLTSMMLMTELLETAPPEKKQEFVNNIQSSLIRVEWLVSSLLKMAKLEALAIDFKKEEVTSSELVELAVSPLMIQLELKNQEIRLIGDEFFTCDKRWTAEALTNIIKNASEHSPVGSVITVEVGKNPICKWISVTDEGPGLSRAEVAKVFKRFETSNSTSGYGIGVPLASIIMKSQAGDIEVNGGGQKSGATFTLKFYNNESD